jgi:hypothetical protein
MMRFIRQICGVVIVGVAASLAACGGATTVGLGGTVSGLTTDGLVLANNGITVAIPANAASYEFPRGIDSQSAWKIVVQNQPQRFTCTVANATGTASGIAITQANVTCTQNTFQLGGTLTGLNGNLTLTNGSDSVTLTAGATAFTFPHRVPDGATYGVAVLAQPSGQNCTVSNGTAVMSGADVNNVQVTCL